MAAAPPTAALCARQPGPEVGDEPALIARSCAVPVFVACAAHAAARMRCWRSHPGTDVIVCDDGLQHLALARDVEICVFNDQGTGNGFLLPAGPLREPWPRPVDLVLHAGDTGSPPPMHQAARRPLPCSAAWRTLRVRADGSAFPGDLRGQPLLAVAGIARPE
jgi:tetraacyldisaccharide 4'-kinase